MRKYLLVSFVLVFALTGCKAFSKEKQLQSPSNLNYDGERITWDSVEDAQGYKVSIGGNEYKDTDGLFAIYSSDGDFNLEICAYAEGDFIDGCSTIDVVYADLVENLRVVDGILSWDEISDADGYIIKINGVEMTGLVYGNRYEQLNPGQSQAIEVKPFYELDEDKIYVTNYSTTITVTLIEAPVLEFENSTQTVYWNAIPNADGYRIVVSLNGEVVKTIMNSESKTDFTHLFLEAGEYEISVQTLVDADDVSNSKYSNPLEIIRLANPESLTLSEEDGVTHINFTNVRHAESFEVTVNDVVINMLERTSFTYSFSPTVVEETSFIEIFAKGDNALILDAIEAKTFEIIKLAVPNNLTMNEGLLRWDVVNKATGYNVVIDGEVYQVEDTHFEVDMFLNSGSHTVYVEARGNGTFITDSDSSDHVQFTKLHQPSNLSVSNYVMSWSPVQGATEYKILIDDLPPQYANTSSFNINPSDVQDSTIIKVIAMGDGKLKLDSNYSESHALFRLQIPTNLKTDNSNITWDSVQNADYYELYINSVKYTVTGTSFSWDSISTGQKTITVQAIGDGTTYFDSEQTAPIGVEKLVKPVITIENNTITWNNILGNNGYELVIGDKIINIDRHDTEYNYEFVSAGTYDIKVKAIGDGYSTVSSEYATTTHTVDVLDAISLDQFELSYESGVLTVSINENVNAPYGYVYSVGGVEQESLNSTEQFNLSSTGVIIVKVALKGDNFNSINSNYSPQKEITILSQVTNVEFLYQTDSKYILSWDPVQGASSYKITITKRDISNNVIGEPGVATLNLTAIPVSVDGVHTIEVEIVAIGNTVDTFDSSSFTEVFTVQGD